MTRYDDTKSAILRDMKKISIPVLLAVGAAALLAGCQTNAVKASPFASEGPFVRDSGRVNLWPLAYWQTPAGSVLWPIITFSDEHFAVNPIYSQFRLDGPGAPYSEFNFLWPLAQANTRDGSCYFFPLFTWRRTDYFVTPVFGWGQTPRGDWSYCLPLYAKDAADGSFCSLLFGWNREDCYITPFFGWYTGKDKGSWLFPLWDCRRARAFDSTCEKFAGSCREKLPDGLAVLPQTFTDHRGQSTTRLAGESFSVQDDDEALLLFRDVCELRGRTLFENGQTNGVYSLAIDGSRALWPVWRRESTETFRYDVQTRERLSDTVETRTRLFLWLYDYTWTKDVPTRRTKSRHRVLWKLWDWNRDGNVVSLDVFPGFTYDSRPGGYTKAALLWRLFRYERDPKSDTSIDFLFIPLWRR